jgi:hypothetical protein
VVVTVTQTKEKNVDHPEKDFRKDEKNMKNSARGGIISNQNRM